MRWWRRFARSAWLLHAWLMAGLILMPVSAGRGAWVEVDADGDGTVDFSYDDAALSTEEIDWLFLDNDGDQLINGWEVALGYDPENADSNADGWSDYDDYYGWVTDDGTGEDPAMYDTDSDGDGLYDQDESSLGSDPYTPDTDYDGISDYDEVYYTSTDPTTWDTDNDGYSDYDEWQGCYAVDYLQHGAGHSYFDWDGDGWYNHDDPWPLDASNGDGSPDPGDPSANDSDGDGYTDDIDTHPDDPGLWEDGDGNGINDSEESAYINDYDWDGVDNQFDSHPEDPNLWNDFNDNGTNDQDEWVSEDDYDGDGYFNWEDSHLWDASLWEDWNLNGINDSEDQPVGSPDSDGDGFEDTNDTHPYDLNLWEDRNGNGVNDSVEPGVLDSDSDGYNDDVDTDPNDPNLWEDHDRDGTNDSVQNGQGPYPDPGPSMDDWYGWDDDSDGRANGEDTHPNDDTLWTDWDDDGLNDDAEAAVGSDPWVWDTDGDGLSDGEEVGYTTNPNAVDSDNDGLTDYEEATGGHGSSPNNPYSLSVAQGWGELYLDSAMVDLVTDSDADGIPNLIEIFYAPYLNPNHGEDGAGDLDSDGVSNVQEYLNGTDLRGNKELLDFDRDGITDVKEMAWSEVYPGIMSPVEFQDAVEDYDGDGAFNYEEILWMGTDPGNPTSLAPQSTLTDGQLLAWQVAVREPMPFDYGTGTITTMSDWFGSSMADDDNDGVPDDYTTWLMDWNYGAGEQHPEVPPPCSSDPNTGDEDGDGMPNAWEYHHGLGVRHQDGGEADGFVDPAGPEPSEWDPEYRVDPDGDGIYETDYMALASAYAAWQVNLAVKALVDIDGDGLSNLREYLLGTHPRLADSDGDGFSDGLEVRQGSAPTDRTQTPLYLVVSGGDQQSAYSGTMFSAPLSVTALQSGSVVAGIEVRFAVGGHGTLLDGNGAPHTEIARFTGTDGSATMECLAGPAAGHVWVTATAPGSDLSVTFRLTSVAHAGAPSGGPGGPGGGSGSTPPGPGIVMFEKRHANASAAAGMITEVTEWWVADRPNAWEQDYERSGSRIISETGIGSGYSSAGIFRDDFPTVGDAQGFVAGFGGVGQQVGWVTDGGFSGASVTSTFSGTSSSYQWGPPPPIDWSDEAWEGVNQVEEDMTHHVVENGAWNGGILEVRMRWLGNPPGATGTPVRRSFLLIKEKQTAGMTEPEIESAETHMLTLDPFSGMSGVIRIHADSSENGVTVTERLLPVEVAPDILAVNSDFDEGRIDPDTGYAIPDCDDIPDVDAKTGDGNTLMALEAVRDHLDGEYAQTERITDDMHEGWFGVNPHLLDDDFWDGATVTIRKLDKDDPDTGRKESGQVRFYAKWGDGDFEYYGIEPYNLDTLAAVNLAQAGINGKPGESVYGSNSNIPENSEFYIEGVRPGKITLEWRYQKGDIDVKHEQTFLVETRLSPEEWKADLAYKIRLDTDNDPSGQIDVNVDPRGAPQQYWVRVERMSEYYDYYQENYLVDDDFQWCGMARLAGSQVIGGASDARKALFLTPSAIVDRIVGELLDSLSEGGFDIFDSLAWQHHVYRSSGLGALEWTNDNSGDNDLAQLIISWRDLDAGLNANDPALIAAAARRMTIYEQQEIIVPTWNKLRAITPVNNEVTNTFTVLAENVMKPNGDRFTVAVPGGDLSNTADRWKWIDDSVTGSPNGIIGAWKAAGKAGQRALVSKTLRIDSARFSLLPGDIEVRDHLDTP